MKMKSITMDLQKCGITPVIDAVQGDVWSRDLEICLFSDKYPYYIPDNTAVIIRYRKEDRTGGEYDTLPDGTPAWTVSGNVLTVTLSDQALTFPGRVLLTVTLVQAEKQLNSFPIEIHVHPNAHAVCAQSEDYFNISGFLVAPWNARKGQYLRVSAVNAEGRVTELEAADPPETFSGSSASIRLEENEKGVLINVVNDDGTLSSAQVLHGRDGADGISPIVLISNGDNLDGRKRLTIYVERSLPDGTTEIQSAYVTDGYTPIKNYDYFDGKDGTSVTVAAITESGEDGGSNVVTFSDGNTLTVRNGRSGTAGKNGTNGKDGTDGYTPVKGVDYFDGADGKDGYTPVKGVDYFDGADGNDGYTPVKGVDYWTEADKASIVQEVITALGTPVFGTVDEENNIILTGNLSDGTYTLKYEDAEGEQTEIGTVVIGTGSSEPVLINQIPISTDTDGSIYNGKGYKEGTRISSSSGSISANDATDLTGFIPVKMGDVIRMKNVDFKWATVASAGGLHYYSSDKTTKLVSLNTSGYPNIQELSPTEMDAVYDESGNLIQFTVTNYGDLSNPGYLRVCASNIDDSSIITVNQEIV